MDICMINGNNIILEILIPELKTNIVTKTHSHDVQQMVQHKKISNTIQANCHATVGRHGTRIELV